jgi:hypothetical protein
MKREVFRTCFSSWGVSTSEMLCSMGSEETVDLAQRTISGMRYWFGEISTISLIKDYGCTCAYTISCMIVVLYR